jgi:MFS family permease
MAEPQYPSLSRNKNFLAFLFGRGVSSLGDYFGNLALSWLVYAVTSSALALAFTWIAFMVPRSVIRLYGGVYVDKWNRRRMMLGTETSRAALFGAIGIATMLSYTPVVFIFAIAFSVGSLGALFDLAADTVTPALVGKDRLLRANSTFEAAFEMDGVAGPALAGVTIALFGTAAALLADSMSFVVLVFALLMISIPSTHLVERVRRSWTRDFKEGYAVFKTRMDLVWMSVLVAGANFGLGAFWYVYALIFADDILKSGSFGYGMIGSISSVGILVGVLYLGKIKRVKRRRLSILASLFGMGTFLMALAFTTTLPEALVAIFGFGLFVPFADIITTVYYQETVPGTMLGRMFGFKRFIEFLTAPISILFGAFMAEYLGVVNGILIAGLVVLGCGLIGVFARPLKNLVPPPEPQQPI